MIIDFHRGDAMLLVDVQVDFCPGGALAVPDGDKVVPPLNHYLAEAELAQIPVYASRDWHPRRHPSFASEGGRWPPHCIQDTPAAAFHPDLHLPDDVILVTKGTRFDKDQYSVFDDTGFEARLRRDHVTRLFVGGLALDVCVRATVLHARTLAFDVYLIPSGTRALTSDGAHRTLDEFRSVGVVVAEDKAEVAA